MNRFKLTTQINIIFSAVTIVGCVVFIFILNLAFSKGYELQNQALLDDYYEIIKEKYQQNTEFFGLIFDSAYNDFIIVVDGEIQGYSENFSNWSTRSRVMSDVGSKYGNQTQIGEIIIPYTKLGNIAYLGGIVDDGINPKYTIIALSNTQAYINDMSGNVPFFSILAFLNILVLGNIIVWLWSSYTAKSLKELKDSVEVMVKENYRNEIKLEGPQEIVDLAHSIDNMRQEIKSNDRTKKEMVQNVGHDLKTPIAVIKSYAEAIADGVVDKESAQLIIKQSDILTNKVKQIIEYNKIGYLEIDEKDYQNVSFAEIIQQIMDHYRFLTKAEWVINIKEDWLHLMVAEYMYIAISNIIDNAIRYVKTKIVITLENKKLTIYNDGELIDEAFLPKIFKAYEKGSKGQFGLGMAIVSETVERFKLKVKVENVNQGVLFTIEPQ